MRYIVLRFLEKFTAGNTGPMLNCRNPSIAPHVNEGAIEVGEDAREGRRGQYDNCCAERLTGVVAFAPKLTRASRATVRNFPASLGGQVA